MAGGTFTAQNKILPGVYINVESQPNAVATVGERGVVAIPKALSWGPTGTVMEITPGEDTTPYIGYPITAPEARFLLEMMRGTDVSSGPKKILLFRYTGSSGAKSTVTGSLTDDGDTLTYTVTAKYDGVRGDDISFEVAADPDATGYFYVNTYLAGTLVDRQYVDSVSDVVNNDYATFTLSGDLVNTSVVQLASGADPTVSSSDDAAAMTAFEPYTWDVLCYTGTTALTISAYTAYLQRINETLGRKCQLVIGNTSGQNSKYVISLRNGVKMNDGTTFSAEQAACWLAGAEAGARYNQSLTYAQYPGAAQANPKLSYDDQVAAIEAGQIAFIDDFGMVKILSDINSKTTVTTAEGAEFKKNRVMRVVNQICNDCYEHFSTYFIGKVDNNAAGRTLFRAWLIGYLNAMQAANGIQNFAAEDVEVLPGEAIDAIVINVIIQPVDSIEKIYMTVTVDATGVTVAAA